MNRKILAILAILAVGLAVVVISIEAQRGGGSRGGGMGSGSGGGGMQPEPNVNDNTNGNINGNFPLLVAPYGFNIEVGESRQFTYWDHDIAVSYLSASPKQVVIVTLDGNEKLIEVDTTFTGEIYWEEENIDFSLEPVVLGVNEVGKPTLIRLGGTWNTTMLRFEAWAWREQPPEVNYPPPPPPGNY